MNRAAGMVRGAIERAKETQSSSAARGFHAFRDVLHVMLSFINGGEQVQFDGGLERGRVMLCVQGIENMFRRWPKRRGNRSSAWPFFGNRTSAF